MARLSTPIKHLSEIYVLAWHVKLHDPEWDRVQFETEVREFATSQRRWPATDLYVACGMQVGNKVSFC